MEGKKNSFWNVTDKIIVCVLLPNVKIIVFHLNRYSSIKNY